MREADLVECLKSCASALEKGDFIRVQESLEIMRSWTPFLSPAALAGMEAAGLSKLLRNLGNCHDVCVRTASQAVQKRWRDIEKMGKAPTVASEVHALRVGSGASSGTVADTAPTVAGTPQGILSSSLTEGASIASGVALPSLVVGGFDNTRKCSLQRLRILRKAAHHDGSSSPGPVVYWMSRDQRVLDNWALTRAQDLAEHRNVPLVVVFCLLPTYAGAQLRAYGFMLRGLAQVEADLAALGIPFRLLLGQPAVQVAGYANALSAAAVVADACPLRVPRAWKADVAAALHAGCTLEEVDAHNIVPVWRASEKQEVGARTIRRKIHALVAEYCTGMPAPRVQSAALSTEAETGLAVFAGNSSSASAAAVCLAPNRPGSATIAWEAVLPHLSIDAAVPEVTWCVPGERAAHAAMAAFLEARLKAFDALRNDPTKTNATSNLSAYLHFGQLSAQRVVLEVMRRSGKGCASLFVDDRKTGAQTFCEELVVRRELSDNFCYYCPAYDSVDGAAGWARESLALHAADKRPFVYTLEQFEAGNTHEQLWNAAQMELVHSGKLHGFMRMYWAKKILEWSSSPAEALRIAIHLNDKYELDGRDPNGYVGCMWAICGTHDMGWAERPVFGKVRYMNLAGCQRKFKVAAYISANPVRPLPATAAGAGAGRDLAASRA